MYLSCSHFSACKVGLINWYYCSSCASNFVFRFLIGSWTLRHWRLLNIRLTNAFIKRVSQAPKTKKLWLLKCKYPYLIWNVIRLLRFEKERPPRQDSNYHHHCNQHQRHNHHTILNDRRSITLIIIHTIVIIVITNPMDSPIAEITINIVRIASTSPIRPAVGIRAPGLSVLTVTATRIYVSPLHGDADPSGREV